MKFSIATHQLEAFLEVAKRGSFSQAAQALNVTQSALSQRILNLESQLESAVFIRDPRGLRLTPSGEKLLRYGHEKARLEEDLALAFSGEKKTLKGCLRIAGFSSIMRSWVVPRLAPWLVENRSIRLELFTRETGELFPMLQRSEVDFIVTLQPSQREEIVSLEVGTEEYVLVRPKGGVFRENTFLDHDPSDVTTRDFWRLQKKKPPQYQRDFLDEVYALQDGVALGLGQAVLPKHLVEKDKRLVIAEGLKTLRQKVYLEYYRQSYYSSLFLEIQKRLNDLGPTLS